MRNTPLASGAAGQTQPRPRQNIVYAVPLEDADAPDDTTAAISADLSNAGSGVSTSWSEYDTVSTDYAPAQEICAGAGAGVNKPKIVQVYGDAQNSDDDDDGGGGGGGNAGTNQPASGSAAGGAGRHQQSVYREFGTMDEDEEV